MSPALTCQSKYLGERTWVVSQFEFLCVRPQGVILKVDHALCGGDGFRTVADDFARDGIQALNIGWRENLPSPITSVQTHYREPHTFVCLKLCQTPPPESPVTKP